MKIIYANIVTYLHYTSTSLGFVWLQNFILIYTENFRENISHLWYCSHKPHNGIFFIVNNRSYDSSQNWKCGRARFKTRRNIKIFDSRFIRSAEIERNGKMYFKKSQLATIWLWVCIIISAKISMECVKNQENDEMRLLLILPCCYIGNIKNKS